MEKIVLPRIRLMKEADLPRIARLIDGIFRNHDKADAISELKLHFKIKKAKLDDGSQYWTAVVGKRVMGFIGMDFTMQDICWVSWLGVRKRAHGRGIGKRLFEHVLEEAKRSKSRVICIGCGSLPMFEVANKMYEKYGFKKKFRVKNYWSKGDDFIFMCQKIHRKKRI